MAIQAGTKADIDRIKRWFVIDVGFGGAKTKSTGILLPTGHFERCNFARATAILRGELQANPDSMTTGLVLEAPLSASFDGAGNPISRVVEYEDGFGPRPWYVGLGATVSQAACYLLERLDIGFPRFEVALFEAFASFGGPGPSNHKRDVQLIREVIDRKVEWSRRVFDDHELAQSGCTIEPIQYLRNLGLQRAPAVIRRVKTEPLVGESPEL